MIIAISFACGFLFGVIVTIVAENLSIRLWR